MDSVACYTCKSPAGIKTSVECSVCHNRYHFDCTGLSEKLYLLMRKESKETWKCKLCHAKPLQGDLVNIPGSQKLSSLGKSDNGDTAAISPTPSKVTIRKKQIINIPTHNSFDSLSDSEDTDVEYSSLPSSSPMSILNRSCPDIAESLHLRLETMDGKIASLREKLLSAECEIENLLLENSTLKQTINEYSTKINKLTHICEKTPKNSPKTGRKSLSKTPIFTTPCTRQPTPDTTLIYRDIRTEAGPTNPSLAKQLERTLVNETLDSNVDKSILVDNIPEQHVDGQGLQSGLCNFPRWKKKVCLLSSNKRSPVLRCAQRSLGDDFQICHFLTPGAGIGRLLVNLDEKLVNYSAQDCCVVLIGEDDFKKSQNYLHLVKYIKENLEKVKHTNIILCLPTFNCGNFANMYNWRVEVFNKLLYQDILKHEYAYIVDSNRNLTYDNSMFHKWSGCLNNKGMGVVFQDIEKMLMQTDDADDTTSLPTINSRRLEQVEDNEQKTEEFFR